MIINRPSIRIYTCHADRDILKEICAGIEEEGVLYEIEERQETELDVLCYDAANESVLGTGVGVAFSETGMQMKGVPKGRNLFEVSNPTSGQCRILGANAARAVKRMPFRIF
ncbi:glycerol dehydratase reactivase beta/small subunit family protein [Anaerobium acetethylicum]|uniref:Dehydratase medium subunit n=1 Tax=Anaerobium acetethylicum TaxID=1619234 RepID=A0A1D3TRY3_9FIRM|nr:glycerol dehydratase reactivase beta/small subunit family protein [Anaerobium acetethylicum]SCP96530.1 Dehydratase medium subunit [Anaerobium acetethylicum]